MAGRAGRRGCDQEGWEFFIPFVVLITASFRFVVFCGFNVPAIHDIVNVIQKPSVNYIVYLLSVELNHP